MSSSPISAFPPPFPTADELARLISLVPSTPPSSFSPSLLSVLAEILAPCRLPGALDFLLNPDINPLSVLTSPINRHAACCSDVTVTAVEASDACPSDLDAHFNGIYAFIPAFNIADTQLGFGIRKCQMQCTGNTVFPRCGLAEQPSIFRFLRNDSAHVLLLVQDHVEPIIKFDYMRLLNGATRRRHFVAFSRSALRALHRSHSSFEPLQLAPHVVVFTSCTDRRHCTVCGNPPTAPPCFCVVNIPKPLHALDFDVMTPAMSAHLGSFEGLSSMNLCTQGVQVQSALMGSRMTITAHVDNHLLERLSRWAITEQLSNTPDNPLKDMLLSSSPCSRSTASHHSASAHEHSSSPTTSSADVSSVQLATTSLPQTFSSSQMTAILHTLGEAQVSTITTLHDGKLQNSNTVLNQRCQTHNITDLVSQPLQPNHDATIIPEQMEDVNQWQANLFDLPLPLSATERYEKTPLQQPPPGVVDDQLQLTTLLVDDATDDSVRENATVPDDGSGRPKAVNIAPAGGIVPVDNSKSKEQEHKERKAEMRRQRNREAAQRSNLKRKMKNDTLKAELKRWHVKATELRNTELGLREENLRLRKMLSGG